MRCRSVNIGLALVAVGLACTALCFAQSKNPLPPFSCLTFPADESEAHLVVRFGIGNVTTAPVLGGGAEGDYNDGTVLFANRSDSRVEIFWKDRTAKQKPAWVRVQGEQNRWRAPISVSVGTDLQTIERLNRRPFRLAGFGFDGAGAVLSWAGGRLETPSSAECKLRIWLRPTSPFNPATAKLANQVAKDADYSSGHPAMQALNPRVYQMLLVYGR
jgi:hypothetical protein